MNLPGFFKKKEHVVQAKTQQSNATLYPDQILIATEDKTVAGFTIATSAVTKLPVNATSESIGQTIRKHLLVSKTDVPTPSDFKAMYQDFLNAAGLINAKAHYKNARQLFIYQKDEAISISPTINGGQSGKEKGFLEMSPVVVNAAISDRELGEQIKHAWLKCVDNSV